MDDKEDIKTKIMPLLPLRGLSIFPHMILHFDVGREKSILSLEQAMVNEQLIFLVAQKDANVDSPTADDIYNVGTISRIKQILKLPGDSIRVLVEGMSRAQLIKITKEDPYFEAEVEEKHDSAVKDKEDEAYMRKIMESFEEYVKLSNQISPEVLTTISDIESPGMLADVISSYIYLKPSQKQELLNAFEPKERLAKLYGMLINELDILNIERKIGIKVKKQIDKVQKEYYLREQLKAIQEELGDKDGIQAEISRYKKKMEKAKLPKEVKNKMSLELDRLEKMGLMSAESGVIRTYLDWVLSLPWNKETKDNLDIKNARKVLESEHYGLKDVKERIIEYLAIRKLNKNMKGPILCLSDLQVSGKHLL